MQATLYPLSKHSPLAHAGGLLAISSSSPVVEGQWVRINPPGVEALYSRTHPCVWIILCVRENGDNRRRGMASLYHSSLIRRDSILHPWSMVSEPRSTVCLGWWWKPVNIFHSATTKINGFLLLQEKVLQMWTVGKSWQTEAFLWGEDIDICGAHHWPPNSTKHVIQPWDWIVHNQ